MTVVSHTFALFAAALLIAGPPSPAGPGDGQAGAARTPEQRLSDALRGVINRGADLYNQPVGDPSGCYRLFQGALMAARPQLDAYPDLQKQIDAALAEAERQGPPSRQAFALRRVLDQVRATISPKKPEAPKLGPGTPEPADGTAPKGATLWDRLGGEAAVKRVVDDFVTFSATNPQVNFMRGGKYALNDAGVAQLKRQFVEFISQAAGGPLKYSGRSMKEVHQGMGITEAEFDAAKADLRKALEANAAKPADAEELLRAVEATRKDIVEPKKPES
jgi:hemoglobin